MMTLPDFRRFRDMAVSEDPAWTTHYKDGNLTVQSIPPGDNSTSLNIIRASYTMKDVPPRVLYDQLHDSQYRATWDTNMIEGYNITKFNPHNDIGYYSAKFPWPLKNRDFCNMRSWMEFTNGDYIIFNHSEPHSSCPENPNFIRAISFLTGYYIRPLGKGTLLTYITHSDPKGSIPHSVINWVMKKGAAGLLNKCEKMSEKYPEFAEKTYPVGNVFPWTTPKMDWDSMELYPSEETTEAKPHDEAKTSTSALPAPTGEQPEGTTYTSLAPAGPLNPHDVSSVQQYRTVVQDLMNTVDRSFLREQRIPTTREYIIRLKYSIEAIRRTMVA